MIFCTQYETIDGYAHSDERSAITEAIQVLQIHKAAAGEEVFLHISNQSLYFTLCLRCSHTATFRNPPFNGKIRELRVPNYITSFTIRNHSFHIVCEKFSGNLSEILECMQHAVLHAAQITALYKFNVFGARVSQNQARKQLLSQLSLLVQILTEGMLRSLWSL